jgi:hypothetical protein
MDTREYISREQAFEGIQAVAQEINKVIVGQEWLIQRLLIGLFSEIPYSFKRDEEEKSGYGHVLLEGVPGLAKTLTVMTLANTISAKFQRIQFTPDLLPADIIGTRIFDSTLGTFRTEKGPIFANLILADEINRATQKTQSALLEAMQERQVTIGETTYPLEEPFWVLATQNPVEQEGVYRLPEAQLDRFLLYIKVDYPSAAEEWEVARRVTTGLLSPVEIIRLNDPNLSIVKAAGLSGNDVTLLRSDGTPLKTKAYAVTEGFFDAADDCDVLAIDLVQHAIVVSRVWLVPFRGLEILTGVKAEDARTTWPIPTNTLWRIPASADQFSSILS